MVEPFKNLINAALVQTAAAHLARHDRGFDAARFTALALPGLDALEMKARALQICAALEATLPPRFEEAADLIEARSRKFAVRQIRWFRRDPRIRWFDHGGDPLSLVDDVDSFWSDHRREGSSSR